MKRNEEIKPVKLQTLKLCLKCVKTCKLLSSTNAHLINCKNFQKAAVKGN